VPDAMAAPGAQPCFSAILVREVSGLFSNVPDGFHAISVYRSLTRAPPAAEAHSLESALANGSPAADSGESRIPFLAPDSNGIPEAPSSALIARQEEALSAVLAFPRLPLQIRPGVSPEPFQAAVGNGEAPARLLGHIPHPKVKTTYSSQGQAPALVAGQASKIDAAARVCHWGNLSNADSCLTATWSLEAPCCQSALLCHSLVCLISILVPRGTTA